MKVIGPAVLGINESDWASGSRLKVIGGSGSGYK